MDPRLRKGRKSDAGTERPRIQSTSKRRKTIGPQMKENPMLPKTPTNFPKDETTVRNRLMLGSATSYYFHGAPPTPVQKLVQQEHTRKLLEDSLNDDALNPPTTSSYLSSSSSDASQDPLNVSMLSDTTELAASRYVALAATQRHANASSARPPLALRRRTIDAPSTRTIENVRKERRASLAPRITSDQPVSADDEHTGEILLSRDMQALLNAGTLSDDEDIAPPRRKSLTYEDHTSGKKSPPTFVKRQPLSSGDTADIGDLFNDNLFDDDWPTDTSILAPGESGSMNQTQGLALLQDQEVESDTPPKTAHTDERSKNGMQEDSSSPKPKQLSRRRSLGLNSSVRIKSAHKAAEQAIKDTEPRSMDHQESPSKGTKETQINESPRRKSASKRTVTQLKSPPRATRGASNTGVADSPARNTRSSKVARVDKSNTVSSVTKKSPKSTAVHSPRKEKPKDKTILLDSPARNTRSKSPKKKNTPTRSVVEKKRQSVHNLEEANESKSGADDSGALSTMPMPTRETNSTLPIDNDIIPVQETPPLKEIQDQASTIESKAKDAVSKSVALSSPAERTQVHASNDEVKSVAPNEDQLSLKSGSSDEDEPAGSFILNSDDDETGDFWSGLLPQKEIPEDSGQKTTDGGVKDGVMQGFRPSIGYRNSTFDHQPRKENHSRTDIPGHNDPESPKRKVSSTRRRSLLQRITNGEAPFESASEFDAKRTDLHDENKLMAPSGTIVDTSLCRSSEKESSSVEPTANPDEDLPETVVMTTTTREIPARYSIGSISSGEITTAGENCSENDQQTTAISLGALVNYADEQGVHRVNTGVNFDTTVSGSLDHPSVEFETQVERQNTTSSTLGQILKTGNVAFANESEVGASSDQIAAHRSSQMMGKPDVGASSLSFGGTSQEVNISSKEITTAASSMNWTGNTETHDKDTTASFGGILDETETSKSAAEVHQISRSNRSSEKLLVHSTTREDTALSLGGIMGGQEPSEDCRKESTTTGVFQNVTATHSLGALLDGTDLQRTTSTLASTAAGANRTATLSLNTLLNGFTPVETNREGGTYPSILQGNTDTTASAQDTVSIVMEHSGEKYDVLSGNSQPDNAIGTDDRAQTTRSGGELESKGGVSVASSKQDGTISSLGIRASLSPASGITTPESMAHLPASNITADERNSTPVRPRIVEFPVTKEAKSAMASSLTPTKLRGQPRRVPGCSPKALSAQRRSTTPTQLKLRASRFSLPPQLPRSSSKRTSVASTGLKAPPQRRLNSPGGASGLRRRSNEFLYPEETAETPASQRLSSATPVASKESLPSKDGLLSALRRPGSKRKQNKSVCFGSPEMAEYNVGENPSAGLTPLPKNTTTESTARTSAISGSLSRVAVFQGHAEKSDQNTTSPESDMSTDSSESTRVLEDDSWNTTAIRELDSSNLSNEFIQTQLSVEEETLTLETDLVGVLENVCDTSNDRVDEACGTEHSSGDPSIELQTIDNTERLQFPTNKKPLGSDETVELEINMHELLNQSPTRSSGNDISANDKKILWPQESVDVEQLESPRGRRSISSHSICLNSRSKLSISFQEQAPEANNETLETHTKSLDSASPHPASPPSIRVGQIVPCSKGWPPSPPHPDPLLETLERLRPIPISNSIINILETVIRHVRENTTPMVDLEEIISPTGSNDIAYFGLQESLKQGSDSGVQCLAKGIYRAEAIEFFGWLVRVSDNVERSLIMEAEAIAARVEGAELYKEKLDKAVTSIGNLSARSAKLKNMVEKTAETSKLQGALREMREHGNTLKKSRCESLRLLLENQKLKSLEQTEKQEAKSLAKSCSITTRFSRMVLRCANNGEFQFDFIGDTPKSCFVFVIQWKPRLECRCSSNPTIFSSDGLLRAQTLSPAASYLEYRFQELCKDANRTDLETATAIAPLLQRMTCDFTRVDVVARELSSVKRTYKAALVPTASRKTFRVEVDFSHANGGAAVRATFEISESYPNGPMETNLDVFSESLDSKLLCSYLIKRAKPGIGYLTRTCACLAALIRSETPNRKQTA